MTIDLESETNWYQTTPWIDFTGTCPTHRGNVFRKTNGLCGYCGEQDAVSVDHIIATSKGGSNHHNNLVGACFDCNNAKGDMSIEEFRKRFFCGRSDRFYFEETNVVAEGAI